MATLLEQGIIAAKNGQQAQARALFQQVLLADDRNERAWLWMSEVADSPIERIACIERALAINPDNKTTQLALATLKAQLPAQIEPVNALVITPQTAPALPLGNTAVFSTPAASRKPYRLEPGPPPANGNGVSNGAAVHSQHTIAMPAMALSNGNGVAPAPQVAPPLSLPVKKKTLLEELETVPLLPAILFGTLVVTAVTGIFLLLLLLVFA